MTRELILTLTMQGKLVPHLELRPQNQRQEPGNFR